MIKVILGNNLKRKNADIDPRVTLRTALDEAGIDHTRGMMHLDGVILKPADLDKTFAEFGITEKCFLLNVVKADNA